MCSKNMQQIYRKTPIQHGCSPVNLLHIFRTSFSKNTSGVLLLSLLDVVWNWVFFYVANKSCSKCFFLSVWAGNWSIVLFTACTYLYEFSTYLLSASNSICLLTHLFNPLGFFPMYFLTDAVFFPIFNNFVYFLLHYRVNIHNFHSYLIWYWFVLASNVPAKKYLNLLIFNTFLFFGLLLEVLYRNFFLLFEMLYILAFLVLALLNLSPLHLNSPRFLFL